MAEQIKSPEKYSFKEKHLKWMTNVESKFGPLFMGGVGGALGYTLLAALGLTNPITLILGALGSAVALFKYNNKKEG